MIHVSDGWLLPAGDDEIDGAVVIEVACEHAHGRSHADEARFFRPVGEGAVAIVAPENISGRCCVSGKWERLAGSIELEFVEAGDVEVEIAVMVVVEEGEAEGETIAGDSGLLGNVLEDAFAFVVKQRDAAIETDGEIGPLPSALTRKMSSLPSPS